MIRSNNPAIDYSALVAAVRAQADVIRGCGALTEEQERDTEAEIRLRAAVKRHLAVLRELAIASERVKPRRDLPPRVTRKLGALRILARPLLTAFNYLFKTQRELDTALIGSIAQIVEMQQLLGERALNSFREEARLREQVQFLTAQLQAARKPRD